MLDWLDEPDEDGSQTFREPNDRRTTPSPLPCKTRCEARLDGVGRHTKRPAKCLGQMVVELPEDQARATRDELTKPIHRERPRAVSGTGAFFRLGLPANHSIIWAIIHGILGWLYVIYFALFRS